MQHPDEPFDAGVLDQALESSQQRQTTIERVEPATHVVEAYQRQPGERRSYQPLAIFTRRDRDVLTKSKSQLGNNSNNTRAPNHIRLQIIDMSIPAIFDIGKHNGRSHANRKEL